MNRGDIVYIPFKLSDSENTKMRVALLVSCNEINHDSRRLDCIFAKISSKIRDFLHAFIIDPAEYPHSGLKVQSMIYLDHLQTIEKRFVKGIAGYLPNELMKSVDDLLLRCLGLKSSEQV
jgi:mRNA-degrading endonuclease toxin of MazEF toxin-antitoxin module